MGDFFPRFQVNEVKFAEPRPVVSVCVPLVIEWYCPIFPRRLISSFLKSRSRDRGRQKVPSSDLLSKESGARVLPHKI